MRRIIGNTALILMIIVVIACATNFPVHSEMNITTVGKWLFDGNALDASGSGNHGTLYGNPLPVYDTGGSHQLGLSFNGSNYVQVPDSPSLNFGTGNYSITGWVKTTSTKTINTIIDKRQSENGPGYFVALYNGCLLFQVGDTSGCRNFYDLTSRPLLNDGLLHFFAITVKQYYSLEIKLYIDGVLKNSFSSTTYRGSSSNTQPLYIGKHLSNSASNYTGLLDEIALNSYDLDSNEITQMFLNGSCVGRWALDGNTTDSSGNTNHGTWTGNLAAATLNGLYYLGKALQFNGTNYVTIPDNPTVNFGTGDFSIAFWVKTTETKTNNTVMDKRGSAGYHVVLYDGRILMQIADTSGRWANYWDSASRQVNDGFWHFIVITVDRDNTSGIKYYIDGSLSGTFNPAGCPGDISNSTPLYLGKHTSNSNNNFSGILDEVKLYKRVLITGEITQQFTLTPPRTSLVYNTYYGHLHNHTGFSDGDERSDPYMAYYYARDYAGLDFFGLADHSEKQNWNKYMNDAEWETMKAAANVFNEDGRYVTFWGFEWTSDTYGHVAVINTNDLCSSYCANPQGTNIPVKATFTELLDWLSTRDGLAFFNHPGHYNNAGKEFNHFGDPPTEKMMGMELWNKDQTFNVFYDSQGYFKDDGKGYYDEALARKWKIGAEGSEDNHGINWGNRNNYRTAVLSTAKTRAAIFDALKARRFYSTLDKTLKLSFTMNGAPMGASISPGNYYATIQARDNIKETPDYISEEPEPFTQIQLIKNGSVLYTWTLNNETAPYVSYNVNCTNGDYFYVRVKEQDGGQAISSPIYINY
jgi:hypothetical protein